MRQALILASFLAASGSAAMPHRPGPQGMCAGPPGGTRLTVVVENVRSGQGLVAITVYPDDLDRFLVSKASLFVARAPARAPATRTCVNVPMPGTYAIAVYHDEDGNRKLTRKGLGLPTEGYGFANNPPAVYGLPAFNAVRLSIPRNMETRIRLVYP